MSFHRHLHEAEILLQTEGESLDALVTEVLDHLCQCAKLEAHEAEQARAWVASNGVSQPRDLGRSVGVLRVRALDSAAEPHVALVRVPRGVEASDHEEVHFLWIVLGPRGVTAPPDDELEPFGWMLHDDRFNTSLLGAQDPHEVLSAYERYLDFVEAPPETTLPVELERSGRLFGALRNDIARRAPHVGDDWRSGIHPKALASILFLFFACLAPSVAFGGLLGQLTGGQQGAVEAIIATGVGGCLYALFSGQPLTLIGSTGPIIIFLGTLYHLSARLGVPYLPSMFWVGMWTSAFLILVVAFDGASLIGWFTRFTDEVFAGLISLIFITSAVTSIFGGLVVDVPTSGELLSLLLALGTFIIAQQLSRARRSPLLLAPVREFLADFGPAIAITAMTGLALTMTEIDIPHLAVPDEIAPTTARSWWVDPWQTPTWVRYGAALPALLGCVLIYLDQNITVRLVNAPQHRLRKGAGYHLDLLVVALLVALFSVFGLPWVVAATVRSLNHVRSLADVEGHGEGAESIVSVRETRLTGLVVHFLIGGSLLFLAALKQVPMPVLFGLFLFMGVASMGGNQLFERLRLLVTDPAQYPPTHYVRRVPRRVIHAFTAIQGACLIGLWWVQTSALDLFFPLFVALLVPVRWLLSKRFDEVHLRFLDADETPGEEAFRETD